MAEERKMGTVKWFSRVKGYGFIAADGEEREIFVHFTGIEGEGFRNLEKGQRVSFVVEQTEKGPQAAQVREELEGPFSPDDTPGFAPSDPMEPESAFEAAMMEADVDIEDEYEEEEYEEEEEEDDDDEEEFVEESAEEEEDEGESEEEPPDIVA